MIRAPKLEEELAGKYKLAGSVVVDVPPEVFQQEAQRHQRQPEWSTRSNTIHREVAVEAAKFISCFLRDGDHIGVGSGRGAAMTCSALGRECLPLALSQRLRTLKITTLTGYLSATEWGKEEAECDAGKAATDLSLCAVKCDIRIVPLPIAMKEADMIVQKFQLPIWPKGWEDDEARSPKERTWLPNIAIIGVGVLTKGHRLRKTDLCETNAIQPLLTELTTLIDDYTESEGCPVCDICNRLYFLPPEYRNPRPSRNEKSIKELVEKINHSLVTIHPEKQLLQVERILMVAGGKEKIGTIRFVLTNPRFHSQQDDQNIASLTILCTDKDTAVELLK